MEYFRAWAVITDSLSMLATLVVLVVAIVVAVVMSRRKQCIAGSWLLVLARAGVWFVALGFLVMDFLVGHMGFEVQMVLLVLLRMLLLLFGLLTAVAFLLFKPREKPASGMQEVSRG